MELIITIIVLAVIILLLILYIIIVLFNNKKLIENSKKEGAGEYFNYLLETSFLNKVDGFRTYNKIIENKENNDVIAFVGDSLTDNYNVYECYKNYNVYNRGIGGDTTKGLLKRMNESLYELNPKIIVLLIGINDFELVKEANNNPEVVAKNILEVVKEIKKNLPSSKIILESLYPINNSDNPKIDKASVNTKTNENIKKVNEIINNFEGVYYLDLYSKLVDKEGNLNLDYTLEGLHLNANGYLYITPLIKEKIDELLK